MHNACRTQRHHVHILICLRSPLKVRALTASSCNGASPCLSIGSLPRGFCTRVIFLTEPVMSAYLNVISLLSEGSWSSDEDASLPMIPASLTRVSCNGINLRRRRLIAMACGVVNGFMRLQGIANSIRPQGHAARPYSQPHHRSQDMQLRTSTYSASSSNGASSNGHPSSNGSLQNGESPRRLQRSHIQRHCCHEECSLQRQPPRAHAASTGHFK